MKITFDAKYRVGQEVFKRTDPEGNPFVVIGYQVSRPNVVDYIVRDHLETAILDEHELLAKPRSVNVEYN